MTEYIDASAAIAAAFSIEVTGKQHMKRKGKGERNGKSKVSGVGVSQL
jgi:hypothetical protein